MNATSKRASMDMVSRSALLDARAAAHATSGVNVTSPAAVSPGASTMGPGVRPAGVGQVEAVDAVGGGLDAEEILTRRRVDDEAGVDRVGVGCAAGRSTRATR